MFTFVSLFCVECRRWIRRCRGWIRVVHPPEISSLLQTSCILLIRIPIVLLSAYFHSSAMIGPTPYSLLFLSYLIDFYSNIQISNSTCYIFWYNQYIALRCFNCLNTFKKIHEANWKIAQTVMTSVKLAISLTSCWSYNWNLCVIINKC